jgi:hypothetical protein
VATRNVPATKPERSSFVLGDEEILALARWGCASGGGWRS